MRRVSAGELQLRYELKHAIQDFSDEMLNAMLNHAEDKGDSWKTCSEKYLLKELRKHVRKRDWIDVANFCFMLLDKERNESHEV